MKPKRYSKVQIIAVLGEAEAAEDQGSLATGHPLLRTGLEYGINLARGFQIRPLIVRKRLIICNGNIIQSYVAACPVAYTANIGTLHQGTKSACVR